MSETEFTSVKDVLKRAMMLEMHGKEFFTMAARTATSPVAKELFEHMVKEEEHHLHILQITFKKLIDSGKVEMPDEAELEFGFDDPIINKEFLVELRNSNFDSSAISIALTLEELRTRDFDGDGAADFPNASVCDAVEQYERTLKIENIHYPTTRLAATWEGEWTRFTNQTNNIESLETDQSHYVYVPEQAERMVIDLTYTASNVPELAVVNLALVIDTDLDGRIDWRQGLGGGYLKGSKHSELDLETGGLSGQRGSEWLFNIEGQGFDMTILDLLQGSAFGEVMAEYSVGIELHLPEMEEGENYLEYLSVQSSYSPLEPLDLGNPDATAGVYVTKMTFDLGEVSAIGEPDEDPIEDDGSSAWVSLIIDLAVLGIAASIYVLRMKRLPGK